MILKSTAIFFTAFALCSALRVCAQGGAHAQEGGYADPLSAAQGESIRFYISTSSTTFDIHFYRFESSKILVNTVQNVDGRIQYLADSVYKKGCQWSVTYTLQVPLDWKASVYDAEFPSSTGTKRVVFVVREQTPGIRSRVLVSLAASTWEAYNNYGGKSLYNFNSSDTAKAQIVSFHRPFTDTTAGDVDQSYFRWGEKLSAWLGRENIAVEYCMNTDLDRMPDLLKNYRVFVVAGHDEYWSRPERTALENFVDAGNHLIILGGNTCWWQTRVDLTNGALICYKDFAADPIYPGNSLITTDLWWNYPVNDPENYLTGVSWRSGGIVNKDTFLLKARGFGDYAAWNSHHWIYAGTNLDEGDCFGYRDAIVGYEVDGAELNWDNGIPVPKSDDGTPPSFRVLAISPAEIQSLPFGQRHATMGIFHDTSGGAVFNASTTNWIDGLDSDATVKKITLNIFSRFIADAFPPDIVAWGPYRVYPDTIHEEFVNINTRKMTIQDTTPIEFFVVGSDPKNESINYFWSVNGDSVGNASTMMWNPKKALTVKNNIRVAVLNRHDTTTMEWDVFLTRFKIVSRPKDGLQYPRSLYRYKLDVEALSTNDVEFKLLAAPAWLSMKTNGEIRGVVSDTPGTYRIVIAAFDKHGNSDTQSYSVVIPQPTSVSITAETPAGIALQSFPNPFSQSTALTFSIAEPSEVTMEIISSAGDVVRTLIARDRLQAGPCSTTWDGCDRNGLRVPSGIYFAEMNILPEGKISPVKSGATIVVEK